MDGEKLQLLKALHQQFREDERNRRENPGWIKSGVIAEKLGWQPSVVTRLARSLEQSGMLEMGWDPKVPPREWWYRIKEGKGVEVEDLLLQPDFAG